jgi:hypothetical protein
MASAVHKTNVLLWMQLQELSVPVELVNSKQ